MLIVDRSPGEMSDEDEVREYQDFSDDDISDVEALPGDDDRPARSHKLLQARPTLASRVSSFFGLPVSQSRICSLIVHAVCVLYMCCMCVVYVLYVCCICAVYVLLSCDHICVCLR